TGVVLSYRFILGIVVVVAVVFRILKRFEISKETASKLAMNRVLWDLVANKILNIRIFEILATIETLDIVRVKRIRESASFQ
ncbi:2886_t:CDS:2, partial [Dentiscutata erythropus]